jgi:transcriptional regulator with AAA-type ATPase domain
MSMVSSVAEEAGAPVCATGTTLEIAAETACATWSVEGGANCVPPVKTVREGEIVVLGSGRESDVRVFDQAVSARHCALTVQKGELFIRGLGSKNGIFVGGARVERAWLAPGASFVLGRVIVGCVDGAPHNPFVDHEPPPLPGIVSGSIAMRRVVRDARRLADLKGPVLLRGETGTGKDVLARAIHGLGVRRGRPFVPLNVGTLPRELADSELFGHERGAYTGAHGSREGAFAQAHGGTLFLDEIAELPLDLQVKLLRVLEDGEVRPIGSRVRRTVDVRVISATWAPLHRRVAEGIFRQDLYQRLAVFVIDVPTLRERRTDIPFLASRFLDEFKAELGARELGSGALSKLASYTWPGNVRELRNVLYRAAASSSRVIGVADIAASLEVASAPQRSLVSAEQARAIVTSHGGNVSAAARQLGVARSTFRDLLER